MPSPVSFQLNDKSVTLTTDPTRPLLWVLRSDLRLTGTKFGCGESHCGACTVVVNHEAVRSCITPLAEVAGKHVLTIEGLARPSLHRIQRAFVEHSAFQCGYCTPGMIMTAYAFLLRNPHPTNAQIVAAMDDNLCRCGAQPRIVTAVKLASTL